MENNNTKFLQGAAVGLALGVAASMFLSTKKGKEIKEEVKKVTADFYEYISPKIKNIQKMTESQYKAFMKDAAEQFIETKKLSKDLASQLLKEVQKSWDHFSKYSVQA